MSQFITMIIWTQWKFTGFTSTSLANHLAAHFLYMVSSVYLPSWCCCPTCPPPPNHCPTFYLVSPIITSVFSFHQHQCLTFKRDYNGILTCFHLSFLIEICFLTIYRQDLFKTKTAISQVVGMMKIIFLFTPNLKIHLHNTARCCVRRAIQSICRAHTENLLTWL